MKIGKLENNSYDQICIGMFKLHK